MKPVAAALCAVSLLALAACATGDHAARARTWNPVTGLLDEPAAFPEACQDPPAGAPHRESAIEVRK